MSRGIFSLVLSGYFHNGAVFNESGFSSRQEMGDLRNGPLRGPLCQGPGGAWALRLLTASKSTRPGSLSGQASVWPHDAWWWSSHSRTWLFLALRGLGPSPWRESTDSPRSHGSCPNSPSPGLLPKPGRGEYCAVSNFRQMASR